MQKEEGQSQVKKDSIARRSRSIFKKSLTKLLHSFKGPDSVLLLFHFIGIQGYHGQHNPHHDQYLDGHGHLQHDQPLQPQVNEQDKARLHLPN